ncbi:unnamed protein product [Acanthoscelides obtectus]|uniref:Transcription factor Adf-1 n=1 Tax=Acanthoscelides obtectus TaxID=200917 RepID=A0A9P0LEB9_ACAOB|nr:unnamed protein product [Acanthoscelides obtectus]CAH1983330.1 unnamed protein product [Acanthoscelides obtectus]CAH1991442.1 unnamed protein product [Acanthoscelides obtectus]CAH1997198.1 unnamed protein product [Acanthoscelides obtectus]CAH2008297.1 unnamed protein product [Acanthoscelides obtectus]
MVDIEKLINEIFLRTPIWDQTNHLHHNRDVISKMWQEIAASCGITIEIAKTKWKNLRDNFRAEVRKINKGKSGDAGGSQADHGSNWVWFKNLLFLKDQMVSRKMSSSLQSSCTVTTGPSCALSEDSQRDTQEIDDVTEIEENSEIEGQTPATDQDTPTASKTSSYTKRKRGSGIDYELLNLEKKKIRMIETQLAQNIPESKTEDDLYFFLMSLHKPLKDLPIDRQMFIRFKIQELLYTEIISANQYQQNTTSGLNVQNSAVNTFVPSQSTQYINPPSTSSVYSNTSASNSHDTDLLLLQ